MMSTSLLIYLFSDKEKSFSFVTGNASEVRDKEVNKKPWREEKRKERRARKS
jgi:hypothetical protein